jgi:hypothetical protein
MYFILVIGMSTDIAIEITGKRGKRNDVSTPTGFQSLEITTNVRTQENPTG